MNTMLRRCFLLLCLFIPQIAWSAAAPSRVFVDDDWASYRVGSDPDGSDPATAMGYDAFGSLSEAVNAVAPEGTIYILGGTYRESLEISKNLHLLGWRGVVTLALPTLAVTHPIPYETSIWVHDADNVTIENINFNLARSSAAGVSQLGIYFDNAGGSISAIAIEGTSYHVGVAVANSDLIPRSVSVSDSIIHGYKNKGLSFTGSELRVSALNNNLDTSSTQTSLRGIELGLGATGHLSYNTIRNNACYTASCNVAPNANNAQTTSSGILIFSPNNETIEIDHNTLSNNHCHLCALSSSQYNSQATSLSLNVHDNSFSGGTVGIGIFDIDPQTHVSATEYGNSILQAAYPRLAPAGVLQVVTAPTNTPPSSQPPPATPPSSTTPTPTPVAPTPNPTAPAAVRVGATTTRTVSPDEPRYTIGNPVLKNIYLSPTGNDANDGLTAAKARKSFNGVGTRIRELEGVVDRDAVVTLNRTGYQIILLPGIYPNENRSHIMDFIRGTAQYPIIFRSSTGVRSDVQVKNTTEFQGVSYVYLLDFTINPSSDALHFDSSDHILVRNMLLDGGVYNGQGGDQKSGPIAHDMFKVNQCQHVFLEDSELRGADDNTLDWVSVQTGRIIGNVIHNSHDWCAYVKGGSAYIVVQENTIYDCYTGGFTAGQGTGFEYMTAPWLFYEAMDVKVLHNKIHHVHGPGLGVAGGYNILLAHNTLYKVGDDGYIYGRTQVFDLVQGGRECDGDAYQPGKCDGHLSVGGWGYGFVGNRPSPTVWVPNKNVFIYNNIIYNPAGYDTVNAIFNIDPPDTDPAVSNIPSPAYADENLVIKGNLIFTKSWYHQDPDLFSSSRTCQSNHPTCSASVVQSDNYINAFPADFIDPENNNFKPVSHGVIETLPVRNIPNFDWNSVPSLNDKIDPVYRTVPQGNLKNEYASTSGRVGADVIVVSSVTVSTGGMSGSGGAATGGSSGSGGILGNSSGGISGAGTGGMSGSGGVATGGSSGSGGVSGVGSGGMSGSGGAATGGSPGSGGILGSSSGGVSGAGTGGMSGSGGAATGGSPGSGGILGNSSGGVSGAGTGGMPGSGGAATGGSSGSGGVLGSSRGEISGASTGGVSGSGVVATGGSSGTAALPETKEGSGGDTGNLSGGLGGSPQLPSPEVPQSPQSEASATAASCTLVSF